MELDVWWDKQKLWWRKVKEAKSFNERFVIIASGKKPTPKLKGIGFDARNKLTKNYFYCISTGNKQLEPDPGVLYAEDSIAYLDRILAEGALFSLHDTGIKNIEAHNFFSSSYYCQLVESSYWTFNELFLRDLLVNLHTIDAQLLAGRLELLFNNPIPYGTAKLTNKQYEWARLKKVNSLTQEYSDSFRNAKVLDQKNRERIKKEMERIILTSTGTKLVREMPSVFKRNASDLEKAFFNKFIDDVSADKFRKAANELLVSYEDGKAPEQLIPKMQEAKTKRKSMPGNGHLKLFLIIDMFYKAGKFKKIEDSSSSKTDEQVLEDLISDFYKCLLLTYNDKYQTYLDLAQHSTRRTSLQKKVWNEVEPRIKAVLTN